MLRALCEGTEEEGQEGLQQLRVLLQSAWEREGRGREDRREGGRLEGKGGEWRRSDIYMQLKCNSMGHTQRGWTGRWVDSQHDKPSHCLLCYLPLQ